MVTYIPALSKPNPCTQISAQMCSSLQSLGPTLNIPLVPTPYPSNPSFSNDEPSTPSVPRSKERVCHRWRRFRDSILEPQGRVSAGEILRFNRVVVQIFNQ
ncbi:hypothetical protein QAD02_013010 [Eretmocerus hayati]|uniref:Uncharacterized protein n=1 Tax=Eretmocerus hayati TaxID=131215 RepID=A0ACC2P286_9HYME|nr:hypothetical protein QAD02_013010 [Eretmocerus hayati]